MKLNGFIPVPKEATQGGAPIDAFQADAFRQNDDLFERLAQTAMLSPLIPNGLDGNIQTSSLPVSSRTSIAYQVVHAKTIEVDTTVNLKEGVPLIWMAQEEIVVKDTINAKGKGPAKGKKGDFGGSGGGGDSTKGQDCELPLSGHSIAAGGAAKVAGNLLSKEWASRALAVLAFCQGGGVVFLCAPLIKFEGSGAIDADGENGTNNAGGGGGGLIVLIAHHIIGMVIDDSRSDCNVKVKGGKGPGTGGDGGKGYVLVRKFN